MRQCEVCESRPADRTVTIERETRMLLDFKVCAFCALFLIGHERD